MPKTRARTGFTPKLISIAVASCFVTGAALANPTGPAVVNGTVNFHQQGNLLQITNSPNAIINWQSFSIGASEITRFLQQSASSAVLNRVIAQNPSSILGALQSNGRVFLLNPNGILFGAGAQVDVAGLVASTLNLSNADFLAGRLKFTEVPGAGSVVNQGNITTGTGGNVYLVGASVTNSGIITSPKGEVILAAGNSVELVDPGTPNLRVEISAPDNEAKNLGQIVADAGRVGIYAGLITHSGTIRADSAQVSEDGRIVLKAIKNATLEAGSLTTANGPNGGSITIQSGDTTLVAGTVEARGLGSPPSQGEGEGGGGVGKGGTVQVLGNLVGLIDNASINVSGETGGGTVLVGGDFQGKNPDIQNAFRTYFGADAMITADAIVSGDGGKVIVWADDATRAYGTITARGGAKSGNGGFVEVSGKRWLDFHARVNTSAPNGRAGTLLLDPTDVEIVTTVTDGGEGCFGCYNEDDDLSIFGGGDSTTSQIAWSEIQDVLSDGNVIITTDGSGEMNGNIRVVDSSPDLDTSNALRLLGHKHITVNGAITNTGTGKVAMYAGWNGADSANPAVTSGTGTINLNAAVTVSGASGEVHLVAGNGITQATGAPITANKLLADGGAGAVSMGLASNMINVLAGKAGGSFSFKNAQSLEIGTVTPVSGVPLSGSQWWAAAPPRLTSTSPAAI